MNNHKGTPNEESVLHSISEKLELAKRELDLLAAQLSSGSVEAKDKFEELKNEFRSRLRELKQIIEADVQNSTVELVTQIAGLETSLLSGKVETRKVFEAQKKEILGIISAVEDQIVNRFGNTALVTNFIHEAEKFKLKLEIVRLKFTVKKFKIKDAFRSGMDEAVETVRSAGAGVRKTKARYQGFREEIGQAYSHMKKAVKRM